MFFFFFSFFFLRVNTVVTSISREANKIMVYNVYTKNLSLNITVDGNTFPFKTLINEIKITTILRENCSKLTLPATYFPQRHFFQNLTGFLQVRTNRISKSIDFEILKNIRLISENALNCFLAVLLKLLKVSFLL